MPRENQAKSGAAASCTATGCEPGRLRALFAPSAFARSILAQLEKEGYAVLPSVFSAEEADAEYQVRRATCTAWHAPRTYLRCALFWVLVFFGSGFPNAVRRMQLRTCCPQRKSILKMWGCIYSTSTSNVCIEEVFIIAETEDLRAVFTKLNVHGCSVSLNVIDISPA